MSESERERKNKRTAMLTTAGINVVVLLLLLFIVAWREPNPPHPETGIELNFGMDMQGSGAVQPEQPVRSSEVPKEEEVSEPAQEETQEASEAQDEVKPVEQAVTAQESPVEVKEEKAKPVEKPAEKKEEKKQQTETPVKKEPVPDPNALFNPNKTKGTDSHGDDKDKAGDKGNPQGQIDKNALYGNAGGGGGGSSLSLDGWQWDSRPSPAVPDHEMGGIVRFEIKVDDNGDIISIRTVERSVSPETEKICRREVEKLTFSKTGVNVPPVTTGTITFVVRSR